MSVEEAHEKVLAMGPQGCYDRINEFCSDVEQLTQAINTLYEQDSAALVVFGVSVKVEVCSDKMGKLFEANIGSTTGDKID